MIFFAEWLEADNCDAKHTVEPICFLSRQGRKTRRVKKNLENYVFVTENGVDFAVDQFRALLSAYLHLSYEFQLMKVEINRFILTLETHMPTDYACAVLEEGKMYGTYRGRVTRRHRTLNHADAQQCCLVIAFGVIMLNVYMPDL